MFIYVSLRKEKTSPKITVKCFSIMEVCGETKQRITIHCRTYNNFINMTCTSTFQTEANRKRLTLLRPITLPYA